jgi:hypothetical protein
MKSHHMPTWSPILIDDKVSSTRVIDRSPHVGGMDKEPYTTHLTPYIIMTSTIYTAAHLASNGNTIPLFSLKGLDNLAPTKLSNLDITGVPLTRQVAYTQYAHNISTFLHATSTRKKVKITGLPLGMLQTTSRLPIKPPPVHFTLKKAISSDNSKKLVQALGPGASTSISGKTTIYQAPALPEMMYEQIYGLCPTHFNCGREAVNPAGALAFRFLSAIAATFLRTHSYPAFSDETEESLMEMNSLLAGHTRLIDRTIVNEKGEQEQQFDPAVYSRTLADLKDTPEVSMDQDYSLYHQTLLAATRLVNTSGNEIVSVAKPCPKPQTNVGDRQAVPNLPGVLFPYFHGLIQPDAVYLHKTVLTHFFQLMGSTTQECQEHYTILRRGYGSLSTTKEGMEVTHLLKGIALALETQTRCFVIYEMNEYKGFVLLGAQFVVFNSTRWVVPGSEGELRDALSNLDPHESSVGHLIKMFSELAAAGTYTGPAVVNATFSEPKNLIDVFKGLDISNLEDDVVREIDQYLRGLNFMGDGYWARNPQTVIDALKIITSESSVSLSRPTYFPTIKLPIHTKEFAALSKFGPESVSFWNEKGTVIECKPTETHVNVGGKRKAGNMDVYANMPNKILVTPKPLSVAVADMGKVMSKGAIKIDLNERAGKYRNMCVENDEMRKTMWRELLIVSEKAHTAKKAKETLDEGDELDFDAIMFKLTGSV